MRDEGRGRVRPWLQAHAGIQRRPDRRVPGPKGCLSGVGQTWRWFALDQPSSGSGPRQSPLQIATNGANKWTVPSALPMQSKSPPQLTAWALSAQRAANTMYRARSLLQKIGRDLIRMTAAMS